MTDPRAVFARHAYSGAPIEVCWSGNGSVHHTQFISDLEAQRLVADLSKAILANAQEKARLEIMGSPLCAERAGQLVCSAGLDNHKFGELPPRGFFVSGSERNGAEISVETAPRGSRLATF